MVVIKRNSILSIVLLFLFPRIRDPAYTYCVLSIQAERRYNSKLYDMRDRLDQANSTTRSMQNYVSFLKSSYSNVFDELESPRWPTDAGACFYA